MDDLLKKNLEAMKGWTPLAAELIAGARVPDGFEKLAGSDGSVTFCRVIAGPPKRVEWLGGTSMPRSAAASMTADMERGTTSAVGLGIGTGYEWPALISRLASHQSLIVYEPNAATVRMVLEVADLSVHLHSGRLVLVAGPTAAHQFEEFFRNHLGFDVPQLLQQLPAMPVAERMVFRNAAEAMIRAAVFERTRIGTEILTKLTPYQHAEKPVRVFFLATPQWDGQRQNGAIAEAEAAVGRETATMYMDQHASCSLVSRLKLISDHKPHAIRSDFFRGELGMGIPHEIRLMTAVPPLAPYTYFSPERLATIAPGANDSVIVHSAEHKSVLSDIGLKIQIDRPGLSLKKLQALSQETGLQIQTSVAMVGDLFPLEAKAFGFELPSHQAVFEAAKVLIAEDVREGTVCAHRAADLLNRAQRKASVQLQEPSVIALIERILRHTLIRTISFITIARQLGEGGLPVKLIGRGWPLAEVGAKGCDFGTPMEMFSGVAVVLHADPAAIIDPILLYAIAMKKAVVALEHPHEAEEGGIANMFKPGEHFVRTRQKELITSIRGLLQDSARRSKLATAAWEHLRAHHTFEKRSNM